MKRKTTEKMAMYRNVLAILNGNQASWSGLPGFSDAVAHLETELNKLETELYAQDTATHGVKAVKDSYFTQLREAAVKLKQALFLLGQTTGNIQLITRHKQTPGFVLRTTYATLRLMCAELLTDLNTFEAELHPFGVDAQQAQEFRDLLGNFELHADSTRQAIIDRSQHTRKIAEAEKTLGKILRDELDRFVIYLKGSAPDLFFAYKAARKVVEGRRKGLERDDGGGTTIA